MSDWYDGPFKVVPGVEELGKMPHIRQGDILIHKSGAVILRCPACNAMQFGRAKVLNSPETPTLDQPLQCGSGHCKKCGVWFSIRNGKAEPSEKPEHKKTELPDKLVKAGVGPARVEKDAPVKPRFRLGDLNRK